MSDADQDGQALLTDRALIYVTGEDARKLMNGIISNDIELLDGQLDGQLAVFAGLLSPQGKILFEFFVVAEGEGLLIDVAADQVASLMQRLMLYRMRAKAEIKDASDQLAMVAVWGVQPPQSPPQIRFQDPRHSGLGARWVVAKSAVGQLLPNATRSSEAMHAYHARRIALGIPEGGKDYDFGDAFPHEANFDLNHGVSFTKGCYVGQEIVSRMEHRGTARKRIVRVSAAGELPTDLPTDRPDVKMGEVTIGRMGSVAGREGLALIRLDRAAEAVEKGIGLTAGGIALAIDPQMLTRWRAREAARAGGPGQQAS